VKLLLDANISPRLKVRLRDIYPNATHVFDCGDIAENDQLIWAFARANSMVIVSKDHDFRSMSFVFGPPPQVILVRMGNASTAQVERALRRNHAEIRDFLTSAHKALLVIEP
jgi:predicted nuclease of predicted toxin-antitoxin system